jgi:hypothetical protein
MFSRKSGKISDKKSDALQLIKWYRYDDDGDLGFGVM